MIGFAMPARRSSSGSGPSDRSLLRRAGRKRPVPLPSKGPLKVHPGDLLTLETPGGGGGDAP